MVGFDCEAVDVNELVEDDKEDDDDDNDDVVEEDELTVKLRSALCAITLPLASLACTIQYHVPASNCTFTPGLLKT